MYMLCFMAWHEVLTRYRVYLTILESAIRVQRTPISDVFGDEYSHILNAACLISSGSTLTRLDGAKPDLNTPRIKLNIKSDCALQEFMMTLTIQVALFSIDEEGCSDLKAYLCSHNARLPDLGFPGVCHPGARKIMMLFVTDRFADFV